MKREKIYEVCVQEIHYGFIKVKAQSKEEARQEAYDCWCAGKAQMPEMEFEVGKVTLIK